MSDYPWRGRHSLAAGASLILQPAGAPWSLAFDPASGATVTAEITLTPVEDIDTALWHPLSEGTERALITYPSPVSAVRVSSAGAGATVEMVS